MVLSFGVSKALTLLVGLAFPTYVVLSIDPVAPVLENRKKKREKTEKREEKRGAHGARIVSLRSPLKPRAQNFPLFSKLQNLPQLRVVQGSADAAFER